VHEIGFAEGIVATARARAGGREVTGVRVRAGVRHRLDAESLQQAMTMVATGTELADATLDLVTVPVEVSCRACGDRAELVDELPVCPACGSSDVGLSGGDMLVLESLTFAEPVAASSPDA